MRAKIRHILEECIEDGIKRGYCRATKHVDDPDPWAMFREMENAIWLEIDERFDFEESTP